MPFTCNRSGYNMGGHAPCQSKNGVRYGLLRFGIYRWQSLKLQDPGSKLFAFLFKTIQAVLVNLQICGRKENENDFLEGRVRSQELDGGVVGGDAWHTELLRQMALDVPDVRTPVLQVATADELDECRKSAIASGAFTPPIWIQNAWHTSSSVVLRFGLRSALNWKSLPGSYAGWPMRMLNEDRFPQGLGAA